MTYKETLDSLYARHTSTYRGLRRIRYVLEQLGNPQNDFPAVLITGTNGKGSVAKIMASVLMQAGYRVGCFTSPHLIDFGERILINSQPIAHEEVVALARKILDGPVERLRQDRNQSGIEIEGEVSFFEIVTAMAFLYFTRRQVDIGILEVGIGGRLDATNTANPLVSVITNVSLDHQQFLGNSVEDIAAEKSAIIREHGVAVTGSQDPLARAIIEAAARNKHATLYRADITTSSEHAASSEIIYGRPQHIAASGSEFVYQGIHWQLENLHLPLIGPHQIPNATVALGALEVLVKKGFSLTEKQVRTGLAQVVHPGRLEVLQTNPTLVVDIAHNAMGAKTIAHALHTVFPYHRLIVVIGILHDKDVQAILHPFLQVADSVIFTSPHNTERAEAAAALAQIAETMLRTGRVMRRGQAGETSQNEAMPRYDHWIICESVTDAIQQACALAGPEDLICVTGSNYTVSEAEIFVNTSESV